METNPERISQNSVETKGLVWKLKKWIFTSIAITRCVQSHNACDHKRTTYSKFRKLNLRSFVPDSSPSLVKCGSRTYRKQHCLGNREKSECSDSSVDCRLLADHYCGVIGLRMFHGICTKYDDYLLNIPYCQCQCLCRLPRFCSIPLPLPRWPIIA